VTSAELDPAIATTTRLSLMTLLSTVDSIEFGLARDTIGLSDSVLSKTATALGETGYVAVTKGHVGTRPRTWLALTSVGREALNRHVAALTRIVAQVPPNSDTD
jgi:DNA-binding MarR family transcriptional regulator